MAENLKPDDGSRSFPVEKEERRTRLRGRPDFSDRREHSRYEASFPVDIIVGSGDEEKVYHARAEDISSGGLCLKSKDIPPSEQRIKLRFRIPDGVMPEEYIHGTVETEAEVRRADPGSGTMGVQFNEPLSSRFARGTWNLMRLSSALILLTAIVIILFVKYQNLYFFWFDVPVFLYSLLVGSFLLSRFLFASFYRPAKVKGQPPPISVIVPAHNEEEFIGRTIRQILESEYPIDNLQLIVVDDGSTDGTLDAIRKARDRYPETIVIHFDRSHGKRHALAAGLEVATGEIICFTDSDSFLHPTALKHLIARFDDPEIAAATGHCEVENIWTNMLTKMQAVRYYVAFRIMKAAESVFGCVTCLSGPLSAYRRGPLMEIVDEWLHQQFLGRMTTFGDDRSLTNALLKRGYKVVYESNARLTTMAPERWQIFMKQQLRWKRSWFRESLIASTFMWKKEPLMMLSFYLGFLLPLFAPLIVLRALVYTPVFEQLPPLTYVLGVLLMSIMLSSTYLFVKRSRLWVYGIHFCFFYMFVLVWQIPWAILTVKENRWGTRGAEELRPGDVY